MIKAFSRPQYGNPLTEEEARHILSRIRYKNFRFNLLNLRNESIYYIQSTSWVPDRDFVWPDDPTRDDVMLDDFHVGRAGIYDDSIVYQPYSYHLRYPTIPLNVNTVSNTRIESWYLDSEERFIDCVKMHVDEAEQHEIDEFFMIDGHRPFDPHRR